MNEKISKRMKPTFQEEATSLQSVGDIDWFKWCKNYEVT
jgi:hypothetical protein